MRRCAGCPEPAIARVEVRSIYPALAPLQVDVCGIHQHCEITVGADGLVFEDGIRQSEEARVAAAAREREVKRQRRASRAAQAH